MFSLIGDKAFNTSISKLRRDFYLNKQVMTFSEAQEYCKNFKKYDSRFELFDRDDQNTFQGVAYAYLNNKPYKDVKIQVRTTGLGISSDLFGKYYEAVPIRLGNILSIRALDLYSDEKDSVGAIVIQVDEIYDELDWQNYETLLKLEDDWLQPDDFFAQ